MITPAMQKLHDDIYALFVPAPTGPKDIALMNKVKLLADQVLTLVLPPLPPPPPPPARVYPPGTRSGKERRAILIWDKDV